MGYRLQFYTNQGGDNQQMGTNAPPWAGNYNRNNWFYNGNSNTNFMYSNDDDNMFIQYGQNLSTPQVTWASARFFGENVDVLEAIENGDGSITCTVKVTPTFFTGRRTQYAASVGYQVRYTVLIDNKTVYTFNGSTIDEFTNGASNAVQITVNVPPSQFTTRTALEIRVVYPNGEYANNNIIVGLVIFNTNPPTYRPNAVKINNVPKSVNTQKGFTRAKKNGGVVDFTFENISTKNQRDKGTNRAKINGIGYQANPYNDNGQPN